VWLYTAQGRKASTLDLCGKGRFGYTFVSHPDRLRTPLVRRDGVASFAAAAGDHPVLTIVSTG